MVHTAFLWMSGSVASFTFVAIATREVSYQIDTPSILFIRSLISVPIVVFVVALSKDKFKQLSTQRIGLHLLRNTTHFVGQFGWFYSIAFLPLAHVFAIEFTVPLWLAVLAPIILKEKLLLKRVVVILVGFAGILIIVQPFGVNFDPVSIVMLIGAIGFASSMMGTRSLSRTETPLCILFYMTLLQLPLTTVLLMTTGPVQVPDMGGFLLIIFITVGILFAHYCMATAMKLGELMMIIPLDYLRLPLIAVAGLWLYQESITTSMVVGAILILSANYVNVRIGTGR